VITAELEIPTIGIGAGVGCDGQVLVNQDMLGLGNGFNPKFLKRFANLRPLVLEAVAQYADEVRAGTQAAWLGHVRCPWLVSRVSGLGDGDVGQCVHDVTGQAQ